MWKCAFYTGFAIALLTGSAEAQYQSFHCPPAEDVWIVEKEFPEASGWTHEARVLGNTEIMAETVPRRPASAGLRPARSGRGQPSMAAQNRPRPAPMLTHDRAVLVQESAISQIDLAELPPVMPALVWLRTEIRGINIDGRQGQPACIYALQDGRDHQQFGVRPAEAMIPVNLRDCREPQRSYLTDQLDIVTLWVPGWDGHLVCDASRTACHFPCTSETILERW
ncbi:MAG: hypothetical protein GC188_11830 [Alphaproteobacteria bacterium]|nr:hypothetical protein [Alphaproteobacteria bacterium]